MMRSFPSGKDGKQETRLLESNALLLSALMGPDSKSGCVGQCQFALTASLPTDSHPISLTGGSTSFWSFWDSFRSI